MGSVKVGTAEAESGTRACGLLKIGELADTSPVNVPVMIYAGAEPGKCLWIQAMIHGDEWDPCLALLQALQLLDPRRMRGCVIAIPSLNVLALRGLSRASSDPSFYFHNTDLNLAFPGHAEGDFLERAAATLMDQMKRHANYFWDMHSGGRSDRIMFPGFSLCYKDGTQYGDASFELAKAAFFENIVYTDMQGDGQDHYVLRHGLRMPFAVATKWGIPSMLTETGGGGDLNKDVIEHAKKSVINVLRYLGIIKGGAKFLRRYNACSSIVSVKAPNGGLCRVFAKEGSNVTKGQFVGTICDLFGSEIARVSSPTNGIVLCTRRFPFASTGTLLMHVGRA